MRGPLNIILEDYDVSPVHGFLPHELPLQGLNSYYDDWEEAVRVLPANFARKTYRSKLDKLTVLSTSRLHTKGEWQRAYVLLTFMTHGYIWGGELPAEILPPCISIPILVVAERLGIPPTATAASLCLYNFKTSAPDLLTQPESLTTLHTFTGTRDEEWFYLVSTAIEARGAPIIPTMLKAMDAVRADNASVVTRSLQEFIVCVSDINALIERMYEECKPEVFYHEIRPALAGSKNMAAAGLLRGVFYDEGYGKGEWRQYSGGSNAQSSTIQFLDLVLGIRHFPTKIPGEEPREKDSFHKEMRDYMPGGHRRFLEIIQQVANIREYAQACALGEEITIAYNDAVISLSKLRDNHIRLVTRYIVMPARKSSANAMTGGLNLAVVSSGKNDVLSGTGGTQLIPFLKQSRDETKGTAIN
ncbi:Indoleamine 2,3-dioxygenase [Calycina marina]|uniref:Indoleamine 2,3-dioxygenase n=1 Tax=Calycina marina TaxID=1763456 RepID=A0A9P8CHR7_9HELO|nr:Indoleamine 2,3-dioxygenase [Calycina marina]